MPTRLLSYWDQNRFVSIWLCLWLLAHGWEQTSDNHHKSESKSPRIFFLVFLPYSNSRAEEQLRPKYLTLDSTKFSRNQFYKPYHFSNSLKLCQTHFYTIWIIFSNLLQLSKFLIRLIYIISFNELNPSIWISKNMEFIFVQNTM